MAESTVKAVFDKESKRFLRYLIQDNNKGVVGTIYLPKDMKEIPAKIVVEIKPE